MVQIYPYTFGATDYLIIDFGTQFDPFHIC